MVQVPSISGIYDIGAVASAATASTQCDFQLCLTALVCVQINRHHSDNIEKGVKYSKKTTIY